MQVIALLFTSSNLCAQDDSTSSNTLEWTIMPLEQVIDSALVHSPLLKYYNAQININELNLKSYNKSWTNNLYFGADTKLGAFGTNQLDQLSSGYSTYAGLKFSLGSLLNRTVEKNKLAQNIQASVFQQQQIAIELTSQIIQQYNQTKLQFNILLIRNESVQLFQAHLEMAYKEFKNGEIDIAELSRVEDNYARNRVLYEEAKSGYQTALMLLEKLVGIKLR